MPLGDSTTASICYRALLWQMLTELGATQFNFVGTRMGDPGCGVSGYDRDNEGHGGYIVTDVLKPANTGVRPGGADRRTRSCRIRGISRPGSTASRPTSC